jgi:hypothetical protein
MSANKHEIEVIESFSPVNGKIFYVRIDGRQQIDYRRGRGDFPSAELARTFAEELIALDDFD